MALKQRYQPSGNDLSAQLSINITVAEITARLPKETAGNHQPSDRQDLLTEERFTVQDTLDHAITEVKRENVLRIATKQLLVRLATCRSND